MKIFITGASGYIGCELAHYLANNHFTVHALVWSESSTEFLTHPNIKIFVGDILDPESISLAMAGCRHVFHNAAFVRICARDRSKFYLHNVTGTENVLKAAVKHCVERLVYTSSCGVWGVTGEYIFTEKNPRLAPYDNDYEVSKLMAEKVVSDYCSNGLDCVIVNPTKIFGFGTHHRPGKLNYNTYIRRWFSKKVIFIPWRLKVTSNLVFIQDVIEGHLLAMEKGRNGEKYILGGDNVSICSILTTIADVSGKRKYFIRVPYPVIYIWAVLELLKARIFRCDPLIVPGMIRRLSQHTKYSSQLAIEQLGYCITPFRQAIQQTMNDASKLGI